TASSLARIASALWPPKSCGGLLHVADGLLERVDGVGDVGVRGFLLPWRLGDRGERNQSGRREGQAEQQGETLHGVRSFRRAGGSRRAPVPTPASRADSIRNGVVFRPDADTRGRPP